MGRARTGLILAAVLLLAGCSDSGTPVASSGTPSTSDTTAGPHPSGYPRAKGRRVEIGKGQTGTVTVALGDVLAVHRSSSGTTPSGNSLVLAEVTDSQLIFQAIGAGKANLSTDDPPAPVCTTTPCPPRRAAPPILTVEVR